MIRIGMPVVQSRPITSVNVLCSASPSAVAEQLRQQLDSLRKEEDSIRDKANSSRLRFMRLSEAVEKLRRQAAVSVGTGKENDARDLLFQKKKVMQVMEKLKTRIETLDKLLEKLNEAISMKESLLIGNMTLDLDTSETEVPSPIRIIFPSGEDPSDIRSSEDLELQSADHDGDDLNEHDAEIPSEISPYTDFIQHIDQQLTKIEEELNNFLKFSSMFLENREKLESPKILLATEILEIIHYTRERIAASKERTRA